MRALSYAVVTSHIGTTRLPARVAQIKLRKVHPEIL